MLVEFQLPLTSKRADVVLVGRHPNTGGPSYLVVELKQWSHAERFEDSDSLVRIEEYGSTAPSPTPRSRSVTTATTCSASSPSSPTTPSHSRASPTCTTPPTPASRTSSASPATDWARSSPGQRRGEFQEFLKTRFAPGASGASDADRLVASRIAPSKQLLAVAAEEVQRREMFVLLDEQHDAYNYVLHAVERARRSNTKTAVIVSGGPGSGKSVIALSLLGEMSRQGRSVLHATGSRSFTQTLRKVAGKRAPRVQKMFQYFNSFAGASPNDLDALILDEAHRIRETSASRWTGPSTAPASRRWRNCWMPPACRCSSLTSSRSCAPARRARRADIEGTRPLTASRSSRSTLTPSSGVVGRRST
jgi:hypothetical protein